MKTQILAALACITLQSFGQQSFKMLPNDLAHNYLSIRYQDLAADGNYISVGGYRDSLTVSERGVIILTDPVTGATIWGRLFESGTLIWSVAKASNGDFLAVGQVLQPLIGNFSFVTRIASDGTFLWRTNLSVPTDLRCITEGPDGNIWCGGSVGGKELVSVVSPSGNLLWAKNPPESVVSVITHLIPYGVDMAVFGSETYVPNLYAQQLSIRKFSTMLGNEVMHTVVGNNSPSSETLFDAIKLPSGGFALATQYAYPYAPFAGRQEIGVIRLDGSLGYIPAMTRAYIISNISLTSPRINATTSNLYLFCTKMSSSTGGTVLAKLSLSDGSIEDKRAIARGASRAGKVFWDNGALVVTSGQHESQNVGVPPEKMADVSAIDPVTLESEAAACIPPLEPPSIVETSYFGGVSAINVTPVSWVNSGVVASAGLHPVPVTFSYEDCSTVLPVEMLYFQAEKFGTSVRLSWATASEHENSHFDIERSGDLHFWEHVWTVSAAGNSSSQIGYQGVDLNPLTGVSYYRLRQVDLDGREILSTVVSVDFRQSGKDQLEYFDASGRLIPGLPKTGGMYMVKSVLTGKVTKHFMSPR